MPADHGPGVKDGDAHEALRDEGRSKHKAAAISNAHADPDQHPSEKGGHARPYEAWTTQELYGRARELDVAGRSGMNKDDLIRALRNG